MGGKGVSNTLFLTGLLGLLASILVGAGEYLLHFDPLARFSSGDYMFMLGIPENRTNLGHFLGVFGATLYPIGCYHLFLMLKPASKSAAFSVFVIGSVGFFIGAVWIGSRASISALVQLPQTPEVLHLIALYDLRYETLLQVVRATTLFLSIVFIWLTLTGRSRYRRWMAVFNPICLILASFILHFFVSSSIGKHIMPIALNVAFGIFFSLSLYHVLQPKEATAP